MAPQGIALVSRMTTKGQPMRDSGRGPAPQAPAARPRPLIRNAGLLEADDLNCSSRQLQITGHICYGLGRIGRLPRTT